MEEYLEKYRTWLILKNYAKRTQKCYLSALKNYWIWCEKQRKKDPDFKNKDAVQAYLVFRFEVDKVFAEFVVVQIGRFILCCQTKFCIKKL